MRGFLKRRLEGMTLVFTCVVLMNALFGWLQGIPALSHQFYLVLAGVILITCVAADVIAHMEFKTEWQQHLVQFSVPFVRFFGIAIWTGLVIMNFKVLVINGIFYVLMYVMTYRMRMNRLNELAEAINRKLAENGGGE